MRIMHMIMGGLNHIHTNGVVHRDLKPENCIIDKDYNLKIIDFGLSKKVANRQSGSLMVGTQAYMAPELFDMEGSNEAYR